MRKQKLVAAPRPLEILVFLGQRAWKAFGDTLELEGSESEDRRKRSGRMAAGGRLLLDDIHKDIRPDEERRSRIVTDSRRSV